MLTCIGAALIDEVVNLQHALHPGASNPARWTQSLGGVAANVFRAARPHIPSRLIAAIGDDSNGEQIRLLIDDASDSLCVIPGYNSGRYCAVLDQQGELVLGLAEADVAEQLTGEQIVNVLKRDGEAQAPEPPCRALTVFDSNLSISCIRSLCTGLPATTLAAMTVSPVKAMRLLDHADSIDLLLTNRNEAAALSGLSHASGLGQLSDGLHKLGFTRHVITDRGGDILVKDHQQSDQVAVEPVNSPVSVNGAGDAMAGAALAHWCHGNSLLESIAGPGLQAANAVLSGQSPAPLLARNSHTPAGLNSP
ncbi:MAG: hypothetical protein KTR33_01040 [Gammaproteobacteria bacterium]|nr:hypothetical protein [Gammaproteobacteria bacterium]